MKKWIIGLGGFLLVMALAILGRDGRQLKRLEAYRDKAMTDDILDGTAKAEKLNKKAEKHKAAAADAAARTTAILEARDEQDPDMGDMLSAWQSKRVRQ